MRILVTGRDGQVGWELQRTLARLGEVVAYSRTEFDLANPESLREKMRALKPDWIINAAAYTAVDRAEQEEASASTINGEAPGILAEEAKKLGAGFVHFSTDYVFDGTKQTPYVETDPTNPLGAYGRTKLAGEQNVMAAGGRSWIFRTSWVYAPRGKNFMLTILRLATERPRLRVVADQYGAPTSAGLISDTVARFMATESAHRAAGGLYHLTADGRTSWHGFAEAIVQEGAARGLCPQVPIDPITTAEYPLPAKRPMNSVMDHQQLARDFGLQLPDWRDSLRQCMDELAATRGASR
ncbi:MAG TPA: dTDP-4-dehydrorhamnose reductase [Vicinamibacterales bacterium]|nr:dTDP-4-dehydrorhamnose reductase [Vicinamibacterales bacterium]